MMPPCKAGTVAATASATGSGREGREKMHRVIRALVLALSIAAVAGCEYLRLQPH